MEFETRFGRFRGRNPVENDILVAQKLREDYFFPSAASNFEFDLISGGENRENVKNVNREKKT